MNKNTTSNPIFFAKNKKCIEFIIMCLDKAFFFTCHHATDIKCIPLRVSLDKFQLQDSHHGYYNPTLYMVEEEPLYLLWTGGRCGNKESISVIRLSDDAYPVLCRDISSTMSVFVFEQWDVLSINQLGTCLQRFFFTTFSATENSSNGIFYTTKDGKVDKVGIKETGKEPYILATVSIPFTSYTLLGTIPCDTSWNTFPVFFLSQKIQYLLENRHIHQMSDLELINRVTLLFYRYIEHNQEENPCIDAEYHDIEEQVAQFWEYIETNVFLIKKSTDRKTDTTDFIQ